jgi:hypothetical protein
MVANNVTGLALPNMYNISIAQFVSAPVLRNLERARAKAEVA